MSHQVDDYILMLAEQIVLGQVNFSKLEQEIFSVVKQAGCRLLEEVLAEAEDRIFKEKPQEYESVGYRKKNITTLFGDVVVDRRLWKGKEEVSGKTLWKYPLDEMLGLESYKTSSPGLKEVALIMGAEKSYRKASELMKAAGMDISHSKVHALIQQAGEQIRQYETEQTTTEGSQEAELVVVESDGIYVARQDKRKAEGKVKKKGLEIKVGIVYEGWEAADPSKTSFRLKNKKIIGTEGNSKQYWEQVDRFLQSRYDVGKVGHFLFGSDGAAWGKEGAEMYGRSLHQVDAFHFQRMIKRTFGFDQQSIVDTLQSQVEADDQEACKKLLQSRRESSKADEKKRKQIEKLEQYILSNWESLPDYRQRGQDLPAHCRGTGSIENAVDNLVADRMKKQGMAWSEKGAGNLVRVRAAIQNGVLSEALTWVKATEEQHEKPRKKVVKGKGRPKQTKASEQGTWLRAGMPALQGSKQNMREFAHSLIRLVRNF